MLPPIDEYRPALERLCRHYRVSRLDLFGSATRADFDATESDLDFLVEFKDFGPDDAADRYLGLLLDLQDLFKRPVDLVSARAIRNPFFRQAVNQTRMPVYAA